MELPHLCLLAAVLAALAFGGEASAAGARFYVSTSGSDSWSGRLASPNHSRTDGPFATLERARDAVRSLTNNEPAEVFIRKGNYFLDQTFVLGPQDTHPVTFTSYKKERVTVSGGRPITGFRPVTGNGHRLLAAQVPDVREGKWYFTQLFVNGRRRPRTRLPSIGYYRVADAPGLAKDAPWYPGQDKFIFNPAEIDPRWSNLGDVDVVTVNYWVESRMQIKQVDTGRREAVLNKPSTSRMWDDWNPDIGARYWIENVFEALDKPGQWYLDRPTGTLYYYPFTGEDVKRLTAIAPRLEQLVVVGKGLREGQRLSGIRFEDLQFCHTEPVFPTNRAGDVQAAFSVPGAVLFESAVDCAISNCEISGIGTYGVEIGPGGDRSPRGMPVNIEGRRPCCENIRVERCRIADMGAGGIKVNPDSAASLIADNEIGDGGKIFMSAIGVWIGDTPGNVVTHNHVHDLDYTGVSVGWIWGYAAGRARDNRMDFNHIHDIGRKVLSDFGGIYTLSPQPGTVVRNNLVHDCYCDSHGGWGIYTDEGSSNILIEDNVVYNTQTGGFHQHYGKENVVRNNVFAFAADHQLQRSRVEEHTSFFFERNIVYYQEGMLLGNSWKDDHYSMDYNLYWDASGRKIDFARASWEDWQKRHDQHGVIADPLFVDAEKHDFRLKPESPALKMGFKQIDVSTVGPRGPVGPVR